MTSGSGSSPHELLAGRWGSFSIPSTSSLARHEPHALRWSTFAILSAACLTIAACAPAASPEARSSPTATAIITSRPDPTQTAPPPTHTAVPEHRLGLGVPLFEDDFELDTGWDQGAAPRGAVSRLDNKLVISVRGPSTTLSSLSPIEPIADFMVEIEVRSEICENGDEFGLIVRVGGAGNPTQDSHYRFLITCDGAVRASRFLSVAEAPILPITPIADVLAGAPANNRIGVSAIGDSFRFFVNDMQVFQLEDGQIPAGRIGVIVRARQGAQTTISFDNFRVWDLAESQQDN